MEKPRKTVMDVFLTVLPGIVTVLYMLTSFIYLYKGDYPWFLVWFSYALANIGLILAGSRS